MSQALQGALLALATGFLWAIGPMCFASIGRKTGAFPVLLLGRLGGSLMLLAVLAVYAPFVPLARVVPSNGQILWIVVSSVLGMVAGDALLYEAFVSLGPRRSTQMLMLSPVFSVAAAWIWMGEVLSVRELAGIVVVMGGVAVAVIARGRAAATDREPGVVSVSGVLYALGAAALIGVSAVAGRQAFLIGELDPVLASFLRVGVAAAILWTVPLARGTAGRVLGYARDPWILQRLLPGLVAGPCVGILCYVGALKLVEAGVVSTLSQTSPLFMLPMLSWRYKARFGVQVLVSTIIALVGVALITWK